jgi:hypothetical protein
VIDYDQYKSTENLEAAQLKNAKRFKLGVLINFAAVAAYGVFLILFALTSGPTTLEVLMEVFKFIVWGLQIFSFALLLFSTLKIRTLIMGNTGMARQVDTQGIRFTVFGVILIMIVYTTSYLVLTVNGTLDPLRLVDNSGTGTGDYTFVAISYICGFVAMLCEFFMIKRIGAKASAEEERQERDPTAL